MVDVEAVRRVALTLPRTEEHLIRDRVKFRVGRLVYVAFSRDETLMGFGFPREEREALVASAPDKFLMPEPADLRYRWVRVRLAALDHREASHAQTQPQGARCDRGSTDRDRRPACRAGSHEGVR